MLAYFCSHILAFDVQVHDGVLQIVTAGAGTAHRMPEGVEYLHCVQAAIDAVGLRYQVLDTEGHMRERLTWPVSLPPSSSWSKFDPVERALPGRNDDAPPQTAGYIAVWNFSGQTKQFGGGTPQTLLCGWRQGEESGLPSLWIGLRGPEQLLCVLLSQAPERSPHVWLGPDLRPGTEFELQVAVHTEMGPGGVLWRWNDDAPWSSLTAASPWGPERLPWPSVWRLGHGQRGSGDQPFHGRHLGARWHRQLLKE